MPALLVACTRGGSDAGRLRLLATNISDGAVWPLNRPMEFRFNQPIDPDSVSSQSILFLSSDGIPVVGTTFVDPCSDGRSLVFQPLCPTDAEASNGGLRPGVFYALTLLAGEDLGAVRSVHGRALRAPVTVDFRAPDAATEPLFVDARPGSPPSPSASVPATLGLNLFTAPLEPLLVAFDQPIQPSIANLLHLRLDFEDPPGSGTFLALPRVATLLENCAPDVAPPDCPAVPRAMVAVVPQGVLPPGRLVRLVAQAGIVDIGGAEFLPADVVLATSAVQASGPAPAGESDAFVEEFDVAGDADAAEPAEVPFADWGGGVLQAADPFAGFDSTFDWVVSGTVVLDTSFDTIVNPSGQQIEVVGGVVHLRNLLVPLGARIVGQGPNPLVIHASGRVTVAGEIAVDGADASPTTSSYNNYPQYGGVGNCGGGTGGVASPSTTGSDVQGEDGYGPGNVEDAGGEGGHSSFGTIQAESRRGGGGGGGVLTRKTHSIPFNMAAAPWPSPSGLNGGNGGPGPTGVNDCVDLALPVNGGAFGPDVFVDADLTNDFFGRKFVAGGDPLGGELAVPTAGQGGGAGGDAVQYSASTPSPNCLDNTQWINDRRGGAGGGGAGILILRALDPVVIKSTGRLSAKGGNG
ncbi:MAG: Ig-like domain-containing protein, partial [Planctomycetota bacterium]